MKIVIDSSVWIAAIGSQKGFASQIIFESCKKAEIEIFISNQILDEVALNLEKKLKFDKTLAQRARIVVKNLCDLEMEITPDEEEKIRKIKYNSDKHILALCRKIQADYLITFDRKHLLPLKKYGQTVILEPKDFIKEIK